MQIYITNTTVVVYLIDVCEEDILNHLNTIEPVIEEVRHLRKKQVEIRTIKMQKSDLIEHRVLRYLSDTDIALLRTAKSNDAVLITDDKKLIEAAKVNNVRVIDTPRLITVFAFNGVLDYEKALEILNDLSNVYNRKYAVEKAVRNLKEWR